MRKVQWSSLVVGCVVFLAGAPAAAAAGTLDQQQTESDNNVGLFTNQVPAQTFTAGITGELDQVDLELLEGGMAPAPVTVEIRDAPGGSPGTNVLATATVSLSAIGPTPAFVPVALDPGAAVTAGTQYTIVAYTPGTPGNTVGWGLESMGEYAGGSAFSSVSGPPGGPPWNDLEPNDLAFKTYVVPAPPPDPPDTDAPETTITKDVKRSKTGKAKFRFSADEPGATFDCRLKGPGLKPQLRKFRDCASPLKYKNLDEGRFKFSVRATDAAGNVESTPAVDKFKVA